MKVEIYHDVLAKKILDKVSSDKKLLRKIERLVNERYDFFQESGKDKKMLLSENDLDTILPYLENLKINQDELNYIEVSRKARRRSAQLRAIGIAGLLIIIGLLALAIWQWNKAQNNAQLAEEKAIEASANADRANDEAKRAEALRVIAEEQTQQAQASEQEALDERKRANEFANEAQQARQALAQSNEKFLRDLLDDATNNIYQLRYQQALGSLNYASRLGFELGLDNDWRDQALKTYLEIAYFYTESENYDLLIENAHSFSRLIGSDQNILLDLYDFKYRTDSLAFFINTCRRLVNIAGVEMDLDNSLEIVYPSLLDEFIRQPDWPAKLEEEFLTPPLVYLELITVAEAKELYSSFLKGELSEVNRFKKKIELEVKNYIQSLGEEIEELIKPQLKAILRDFLKDLHPIQFQALVERYYPFSIMLAMPNGREKGVPANLHLAKTETTVWQYALFCEVTGKDITEIAPLWGLRGDHPVVNVSWNEAAQYANWLSRLEGLEPVYQFENGELKAFHTEVVDAYRLPTFDEWTAFGWKDLSENQHKLTNGDQIALNRTSPVGEATPNSLGLVNIEANALEWCQDWNERALPIVLGGAGRDFNYGRCKLSPTSKGPFLGFRLARGGFVKTETGLAFEPGELPDELPPLRLFFEEEAPQYFCTEPPDYDLLTRTFLSKKPEIIWSKCNEEKTVDRFFAEIRNGPKNLIHFIEKIKILLQEGKSVRIELRGFSSPRGTSRFNFQLAKNRIQVVENKIIELLGQEGARLRSGQLSIVTTPLGEETVPQDYDYLNRCGMFELSFLEENRVEILFEVKKSGNE